MKHEELIMLPQKSRISSSNNGGMTHIIKIHEDITEPVNFSDEFDLIDRALEQDTIVLDLCTGGGHMDTAMLFVRSLNSCAANTVCIIGPEVASAGSVIALSCKEWILDDTSSLMIHTSSYGIMAKDTDIFEHANFSRQQLKRLYENVYSGFLSVDELSDVIKGTPFYFDVENIAERLDSLQEYRENQGCGKEDCTECNSDKPEASLESIIQEAVQKGVQAALSAERIAVNKAALAAEKAAKKLK
ncbi:ATP-dependent Clp protease proteolytic subunit [Pseudomonas sp.]|uniref:ATP-dependent Clp protease proteolytic subunit n=1 Tax=Pseudomonas sp. TaxID=306 RepID=UPI003FD8D205